jgi:ATP-dependent RNA helicase RhlE
MKGIKRAGHDVAVIHADRSQGQRRQALDGFKDGDYRVLVATDIAARGIDVTEIGHVVNFDLPHVAEDYVHRVGRTARMDASGRASAFCSPEESNLLRGIESLTRTALPRAEVPREGETFKSEVIRAGEGRANQGVPPHRREGGGRPGSSSRHQTPKPRRRASIHSPPPAAGGTASHASARPHASGASSGHATGHAGEAGRKPVSLGTWGPTRKR